MALAIEGFAIADRLSAIGSWRDAGLDASHPKGLAEGVTVIPPVCDQHLGLW